MIILYRYHRNKGDTFRFVITLQLKVFLRSQNFLASAHFNEAGVGALSENQILTHASRDRVHLLPHYTKHNTTNYIINSACPLLEPLSWQKFGRRLKAVFNYLSHLSHKTKTGVSRSLLLFSKMFRILNSTVVPNHIGIHF